MNNTKNSNMSNKKIDPKLAKYIPKNILPWIEEAYYNTKYKLIEIEVTCDEQHVFKNNQRNKTFYNEASMLTHLTEIRQIGKQFIAPELLQFIPEKILPWITSAYIQDYSPFAKTLVEFYCDNKHAFSYGRTNFILYFDLEDIFDLGLEIQSELLTIHALADENLAEGVDESLIKYIPKTILPKITALYYKNGLYFIGCNEKYCVCKDFFDPIRMTVCLNRGDLGKIADKIFEADNEFDRLIHDENIIKLNIDKKVLDFMINDYGKTHGCPNLDIYNYRDCVDWVKKNSEAFLTKYNKFF